MGYRRHPRSLTRIQNVRFTDEQYQALVSITDEYAWRSVGTLCRSIVGVWLINRQELKGDELRQAIEELRQLEEGDT